MGYLIFPRRSLQDRKCVLLSNLCSLRISSLIFFDSFQRTNANVVFEVEHDKGGHFAATEEPEVLVGDLRKMFGKGGPAFGVVDGKPGY